MKRSRIRPVNSKRRRERYVETFGPAAEAIRQMPCVICGAPAPSDPHHVKSRGAGGTSANLIPLCRQDHQRVHAIGIDTFIEQTGIDLRAEAARIAGLTGLGVMGAEQ